MLEALNMTPPPPVKKDGRVLVSRLENHTGDAGLEIAGQLLTDHVRRRSPELEWVKEVAALRDPGRLAPEATAGEMRALAKKLGGDALVTGYDYKEGGRVVLNVRVFDLKRERIFAELTPITGETTALTATIEETAERLVGVTASVPRVRQGKEDVSKFVNFPVPRRFDAVQILSRGPEDDLSRYRRSYERDPKGPLSSLVLLAWLQAGQQRYVAIRRGDIAESTRMLDAYDSVRDKGNSSFKLSGSVLAALRQSGPPLLHIARRGGRSAHLRHAGGLEHGDEWDAKIRRQIEECVLFIPVVSAHTQARHEPIGRGHGDRCSHR